MDRESRRGLELDPNDAMGRNWHSGYLSLLGRHDEAVAEQERARDLDPLSLIVNANGKQIEKLQALARRGAGVVPRRRPLLTLLKIDIGAESIDFRYDDQLRVIEARDSSGRELRYTYDSAGRLVRSAASDGSTRLYAYDAMHRMTRVEEPGRIVENAYDADGLLTKQLVWSAEGSQNVLGEAPYIYEIAYKKEDGRVRQTDVRQSSGEHKRAIFDQAGYVVSETYAPDTPAFLSVRYRRDALNHVVNAVTVTCPSGRWRSTHTERVEPGHEHEVAAQLTAQWCDGPSTTPKTYGKVEFVH